MKFGECVYDIIFHLKIAGSKIMKWAGSVRTSGQWEELNEGRDE